MPVNTTWSDPTVATGSGGVDFATGDTVTETLTDRLSSNLYRLGGTDGNAKSGPYEIGATTYSNASNVNGVTIQQGSADDEILSLKSTDVAHGITGVTETTTYGRFGKANATLGGMYVIAVGTHNYSLNLGGIAGSADTLKSTAAVGAVVVDGYVKSGTSAVTLGANGNVICFRDAGTTRHILDSDGDSHQDVGTAWTNFDDHDDVALLTILSAHLTRHDDPLRAHFAAWLEQSREPLERARLVTFNADGHHFVNWSRMHMLEIGAIRQLADRLRALEQHRLPA